MSRRARMHSRARTIVAMLALVACGHTDEARDAAAGAHSEDDAGAPLAAPVTRVAGEVHLHQFAAGAHAWAAFVDPPVAIARVRGDSITEIDTASTRVDGACVLYVAPQCTPACAGASYCASPGSCAPLVPPAYVDGGEIDVTGSSVVPRIRLWAEGALATYRSDPAPGPGAMFAGGDHLFVASDDARFAFAGELPAPRPVVVTSPDLSAELRVPVAGDMTLAWVSEHTDEVVVRVHASSERGSAYVRCDTSDVGALVIHAELLAGLPAPPRATRLEIDRVEQRIFATRERGVGVLAHVAQTTWKNGND